MNSPKVKFLLVFILLFIVSYYVQYNISLDQNDNNRYPNYNITDDQEMVGEFEDYSPLMEESTSVDSKIFNSFVFSVITTFLSILIYTQLFGIDNQIEHIKHSSQILGFNHRYQNGNSIILSDNIQIILSGFYKKKVRFILPLYKNYKQFGLRKAGTNAITESLLESFQMKLLLVRRYINSNDS